MIEKDLVNSPVEMYEALVLLGTALLVTSILVWFTKKRYPNWSVLSLSILTILSVFSLFLILLSPGFFQDELRDKSALIMTEGFKRQINSLPDSLKNTDYKIVLGQNVNQEGFDVIRDVLEFKTKYNNVSSIFILGDGLYDFELEQLREYNIRFIKPQSTIGFGRLNFTQNPRMGRNINITGILGGFDSLKTTILLTNHSQKIDSAVIFAGTEKQFSFNFLPRHEGKQDYYISVFDSSGKTLAKEKIALFVDSMEELKILILEDRPSYETKYLFNWLTDFDMSVAKRTKISQGKFRYVFSNHNKITIPTLSNFDFSIYDILVVTSTALEGLNFSEQRVLEKAISTGSLNMMVLLNSYFPNTKNQILKRIHLKELDIEKLTVVPSSQSFSASTKDKIAILPLELTTGPTSIKLVNDIQGRELSILDHYKNGKIIFSLINESFSWKIAGNKKLYHGYWSFLLSRLTRKDNAGIPQFVFINEPCKLTLSQQHGDKINITAPSGEQLVLFPSRNSTNLNLVTYNFWPKETGWHFLKSETGESFYIYVFEKDNWQSLQISSKQNATILAAEFSQSYHPEIVSVYKKINVIWFFIIFLISSGVLWYRQRQI